MLPREIYMSFNDEPVRRTWFVVSEVEMKSIVGDLIISNQDGVSVYRKREQLVLAVQRLNSFCRCGEVRETEMPKHEWKISQVEKLIGLSRRDIQRACYQGCGGVSILQPEDSSWGRRNYRVEDLAKLFVIKCYRQRGMSLAQIKREFDRFDEVEEGCSLLECQVSLMLDQREALERQIACGRLFEASLRGECALRELAQVYTLEAIVGAAGLNGKGELAAHSALIQWCMSSSPDEVKRFEDVVSLWLDEGTEPDDEKVSSYFSEMVQAISLRSEGASVIQIRRVLCEVLDSGVMEPVLELWLGPGSFELIDRAVSGLAFAGNEARGQGILGKQLRVADGK